MILCDDQAGSKDLFPYLRKLTADVCLTRVDPPFGDFVWHGNGPDGGGLSIAVEYKQIEDVLDCMLDGRFAGHQLPGLVEHYDRRYLLVEGRLRIDRDTGNLQKLRGDRWQAITRGGRAVAFRDLEHWFTTIEEQAQFRVKTTYDEYESARWVVAKHSWYVYKGWEEHRALKQFHVPPPPVAGFQKPGLVRRVAKEFEGVSWERSIAVAAHFASVRAMVSASAQEWIKIDGIGKILSQRIVAEIEGRTNGVLPSLRDTKTGG